MKFIAPKNYPDKLRTVTAMPSPEGIWPFARMSGMKCQSMKWHTQHLSLDVFQVYYTCCETVFPGELEMCTTAPALSFHCRLKGDVPSFSLVYRPPGSYTVKLNPGLNKWMEIIIPPKVLDSAYREWSMGNIVLKAYRQRKALFQQYSLPLKRPEWRVILSILEFRTDEPSLSLLLQARIYELLYLYRQRIPGGERQGDYNFTKDDRQKIREAMSKLADRLTDPISVSQLARESNMHIRKFCVGTGQGYGVTPREFFWEKRMEHAGTLLRTTDMPVCAVAAELCYSSDAAFSRSFFDYYGMAPLAFRKKESRM